MRETHEWSPPAILFDNPSRQTTNNLPPRGDRGARIG
jgi:hypothetical protein